MGWLYLPKIEPTAGQKGFMCGDVFVPIKMGTISSSTKEENSIPSDGLILNFPCTSNTAETGQGFTAKGGIIYNNNSAYFPGSSSGILSNEKASELFSEITEQLSFCCYFNTYDITKAQEILSCTEAGGFSVGINSDNNSGKCHIYLHAGGSYANYDAFDVSGNIFPNTWYFIAVIYNGSDIKVYLNSEMKSTEIKSGILGFPSNSATFAIGAEPNGSGAINGDCFYGEISNVLVYKRALTKDEVNFLYKKFTEDQNQKKDIFQKGICIEFDEKDSAPTDGLVFHFSGETDSLIAETGQIFTKTNDLVIHTLNDGFPCWYTPNGQWMYSSDEGMPTGSSPWTQTVWVKAEANTSAESPVIAFGNLGVSGGGQALSFVNKTAIRSVGGVGQNFTTDSGVVDPFIWNHVAITYDGSTITIYVNGEVVKSGLHSKKISLYGSKGLGIGGCWWEYPFQGWIRDARIYNRALSPSEIKSIIGANKKVFIPLNEVYPIDESEFEKSSEIMPSEGLILHVPLAQSSSVDELGNELTEYGNVSFTTINGIQCIQFDGDSYIKFNISSENALSSSLMNIPFTITLWVYAQKSEYYSETRGVFQYSISVPENSNRTGISIGTSIEGKIFGSDITDGFHFIAVTRDSIGKIKCYLDDVLINSSVTTSSITDSSGYIGCIVFRKIMEEG